MIWERGLVYIPFFPTLNHFGAFLGFELCLLSILTLFVCVGGLDVIVELEVVLFNDNVLKS